MEEITITLVNVLKSVAIIIIISMIQLQCNVMITTIRIKMAVPQHVLSKMVGIVRLIGI